MSSNVSLTAGVIVERVGDDLMVIVPGNADVVSLSGRPAQVLLDVKAGRKVDSADPALRDLVDLGIVSAPGISRRGLIKAGAIGAGAGIAVLAMPGVAAAASFPVVTIAVERRFGTADSVNLLRLSIRSDEFPAGLPLGTAGQLIFDFDGLSRPGTLVNNNDGEGDLFEFDFQSPLPPSSLNFEKDVWTLVFVFEGVEYRGRWT